MKTLKYKLLSLLTFILLPITINAQEFTYKGINYLILDYDAQTVAVYENQGAKGDIVIPNQVVFNGNTYTVTKLGSYAFSSCTELISISIPDGVTFLDHNCFLDCSGLQSINIPDGVTAFGNSCFSGCSSITSINIPASVTEMGDRCFMDCSSLTSIHIPDGVTDLGVQCFRKCYELTSIALPNRVKSLGEGCFEYCSSLTSINIPDDVTSLGRSCFSGCSSLISINISEGVTTLSDWCFSQCSSLSSINIPKGVTALGHHCFNECSALSSINIPNRVTALGDYCFMDCSSLISIDIPEGVSTLGSDCFGRCYALTTINIPNSVTEIGSYCFEGCKSLTSIIIPNSVTKLKDCCFMNCKSLSYINIPNSVTEIGSYCFSTCNTLVSITLPNKVKSIGKDCLTDCASLISVISLNTIPPQAVLSSSYTYPLSVKTLYVPNESISDYENADFWKDFGSIKSINSLETSIAGSGTETDPYIIATAEGLCNAYKLTAPGTEVYFKQTADIDMENCRDWHAICGNSGQYGEIIHYDGQYHVIKNFNPIDHQPEDADYHNCSSLFGVVSGEIINLGVVDAYCESSIGSGILGTCAGHKQGSTLKVENVFVTGSIIGSGDYTGGMFGSTANYVGIYNSYSNVNVKGGSYVGGIIGKSSGYTAYLLNVYAAGTVEGEDACLLINYDKWGASDGENVIAFNSGSMNAIPEGKSWWSGQPIIATEETKASLIDEVKSWEGFSKTNMYKGLPALSWQEGDYIDKYSVAGSGTEADPYLIATAEDFCNAHTLMVAGKTVYFKQTADIDMAGVTDYTELSNYNEISGLGVKSIYYDGGNHVITNFTSTESNPNSIFGYFSGTIKNLGIVNANVEEPSGLSLNQNIGILAKMSYASEGTNIIDNVFITGDLAVLDDSKYWVGPMCGYAEGSLSITNSYVQVEFFTYQNNISGGLLGYANGNLNIANTYVATNSLCLNALVAHANKSNLTANNVVAFGSGNAFGFKINDSSDNFVYENSAATVVPINDRGGIDLVQSWEAFNQKKFYNRLPALNWQGDTYIDHYYLFDKAEPSDGSTFYQSEGIPSSINTFWKDVDTSIIVRGNAYLINENNDRILTLNLTQSEVDYSLINISFSSNTKFPAGTYTINIPSAVFSDNSGRWINEEVVLTYNVIPNPIYSFESANPPSGSTFFESEGLPSSIETYWKDIESPVIVRRNAVLRNENNDSIVGLTLTQSASDRSSITIQSLIPLGSIKVPVGTYYVHIPQNSFADESGVWYNEDVTLEYTILPPIRLTPPTISYNGRFVTINAENGAEILYSVNDSDFTPYVASFDLDGLNTIRAYAKMTDYTDSDIVEYQVHSYGTEMYAELDTDGSLSDAYQWADEATRNKINHNTNLLIYVPDIETANALTGNHINIVINGHADRITLANEWPWHCPYKFEATTVSYSLDFSKQTAINGGCAGWETIALPFDVQTITHEKGNLYPFAANSDSDAHRFWLYEPTIYEWQTATEIEANKPYLIAMPNNDAYYEPFNITGEVTFAAENVTIPATPDSLSYNFRDGYKINANYLNLSADSQRLVVNDEAVNGNEPGSCFVADERAVRPFEAYLTAPGQNRVPIFNTSSLSEGLMSEMALRVWCDTPQSVSIAAPFDADVKVYDISGRAVRTVKVNAGETIRVNDLPSGLYIIAKTKIAIYR